MRIETLRERWCRGCGQIELTKKNMEEHTKNCPKAHYYGDWTFDKKEVRIMEI